MIQKLSQLNKKATPPSKEEIVKRLFDLSKHVEEFAHFIDAQDFPQEDLDLIRNVFQPLEKYLKEAFPIHDKDFESKKAPK